MMKNLKLKLAFIGVLICSSTLYSQGFYLTAGGGYAFTMNGQTGWEMSSTEEYINDNVNNLYSSTFTNESVPLSYGKGLNFDVAIGYKFNEFIAGEIGFSYLLGGKTTIEEQRTVKNIYSTHTTETNFKKTATRYSQMFRLIPSVILSPNFEVFNPYLKVGAVLGFGSIYYEETSESTIKSSQPITPPIPPTTSALSSTSNGGMAFGFQGAFGLEYKMWDAISLIGEVNYIGMSYAPKKSVKTKWEENGIDKLTNATVKQKETEYVDERIYSLNDYNEDEPNQQLSISEPFSSLGFKLGVIFNFRDSK